jgi:uncharacterized repeat protein (TIGR03803 family)
MKKMCIIKSFVVSVLVASLELVLAGQLSAQTFTTLHNFSGSSDGKEPMAALMLSGNTLYGTASEGGGGNSGTVFKLNPDGTGFTVLHTFTARPAPCFHNSDGGGSNAGLILSGNTLYGSTEVGGSWANGTLFAVNTDGTGFKTLHTFNGVTDSGSPLGALVLSSNTLYGATRFGNTLTNSDFGSVFTVCIDGSNFTTLYSFSGGVDGGNPGSGLVLSGNTVYGSTSGGSQAGNLYALNTDGTGFTVLYSF